MPQNLNAALESFVPSYPGQHVQPSPWRGTLIVSGMRASDRRSTQPIHVTAVETDGEKYMNSSVSSVPERRTSVHHSRMDLWPYQLFAHMTYDKPILRDVLAWIRQNNPPCCTFIPTQVADGNSNTVNQTNFRSLSRILFESQTVALAYWGVDTIPGAGMIIYPAQNSSVMLVGALFLYGPFPDFILGTASPGVPMSSSIMQARHVHYTQSMGAAGAYAPSHHGHSTPTTRSNIDQSGVAGQRQDPYRYMVPRVVPGVYPTQGQASSSTSSTWNMVKNEDDGYNFPGSPDHTTGYP
ncbi:hypothetical protein AMATHDRAFT_86763 [Amanita thiersii Skay4041]|uniref:Uncharacterized protein n=1 Tax=Amanita thiersii Skay4041 TaxID=703135 RepID=A0A2A9ND66_9AGAR|nr:hypothetical protein AMATHDRAFT_86763 [Amanita thiersii Skay4041]